MFIANIIVDLRHAVRFVFISPLCTVLFPCRVKLKLIKIFDFFVIRFFGKESFEISDTISSLGAYRDFLTFIYDLIGTFFALVFATALYELLVGGGSKGRGLIIFEILLTSLIFIF